MSSDMKQHTQLLALMSEALGTCILLRDFTVERYKIFLSDDDNDILDTVSKREQIVEKLISLEYQIDVILDEVAEYDNGRSLPDDVDDIRQSIRTILNEVSKKDLDLMNLISRRMQKYKDETLKARNKKNLSAYMKNAFMKQPGDSVDYSK